MSFQPDLGVVISTLLAVLVGLVLIWITVAIVIIIIQEWITTKLRWKSGMLKTGIGNMFGDEILAEHLYDHPTIKSLFTGIDRNIEPDYIPPAQFSLTILDVILSSASEIFLLQTMIYQIKIEIDSLSKGKLLNAKIELDKIQQRINILSALEMPEDEIERGVISIKSDLDGFSKKYPDLSELIEARLSEYSIEKQKVSKIVTSFETKKNKHVHNFTFIEKLQLGLAALGVSHYNFKRVISTLLVGIGESTTKENSAQKIQKTIEGWYVNSLEPLNAWQRRRTSQLAFIVGVFMAVYANVDTLYLAPRIWTLTSQQPGQIDQIDLPIGWVGIPLSSDANGNISLPNGTTKKCVLNAISNSDFYGLLEGVQCYPIINAPRLNDLTGMILKMYGLVLTGVISAFMSPRLVDYLQKRLGIKV